MKNSITIEGVGSGYIYQIKPLVSGHDQATINDITVLKPMDESVRAIRLKFSREDYIKKHGKEPTQDELDERVRFYDIANNAELEFNEIKLMLVSWQRVIDEDGKKTASIPITDKNIKELIPQADWKLLIKEIDKVAKNSRPFRKDDSGDDTE